MGPRALLLLAVLLAPLFAVDPAGAQYFGRNKVQYRAFDFQIIRTENFDVYYYPQEREAALDAARMVERSYARLSRILQHEFRERKPLIVYASHTDFQQTNALSGFLDESTGGATESLKSRMILPFTGSYADFDHVLTHELVHGFQYDVLFRRGAMGEASPFMVRLPLWFMEGMAEYLSIGRVDPHTVSWLRDAVLNGYLRSIAQMSQRDDYLSYRFGQSLWAYIGSKWGDEVVGILLQKAPRVGIERAFTTTLGVTLDELNQEWHASVRSTYLTQLVEFSRPDQFARRLTGHVDLYDPWYLAPSISPDGSHMVYLSQQDGFSFDLWLANAHTGAPVRRLVSSARDAGLESLRYMYSATAFSHDGRYVAFAAKDGGRDALNIYDLQRRRITKRLRFDLNGITSPSWSPDGTRLVFTGLDGGLSDLFITDLDGRLTRLTDDRYADLLPSWSPDGRSVAFTTDRHGTQLDNLHYGNMRVAVLDIATGDIQVLPHQDQGKNINPVWSPDGSQLVWVSDRTGTNDLYLFERGTRELFRITDLLSGAIAVSPLSPVLSWSQSGRLLFTYFENAGYNSYVVEDPRLLPRQPVALPAVVAADPAQADDASDAAVTVDAAMTADATAALDTTVASGAERAGTDSIATAAAATPGDQERSDNGSAGAARPFITSYYRAPDGAFRPSEDAPVGTVPSPPVSVVALLDSAALSLPDTASFELLPYRPKLTADIFGRPSLGTELGGQYGNGVYGGSYVGLSDMLGNHSMIVAGSVNGSFSDASMLVGYNFLKHRANLSASVWQFPNYRYLGGGYIDMNAGGRDRMIAANVFLRDVIRAADVGVSYPLSTFRRVELNAMAVNYRSEVLYRGVDLQTYEPIDIDEDAGGFTYLQPQLAMVFDNSLFGWTGPIAGRRYRLQTTRTMGELELNEGLLDFRNYFNFRQKVVLATRLFGLMRTGHDAQRFGLFWGGPYYIRGYDYNSFDPNGEECAWFREVDGQTSLSRCPVRDQLVGSNAAFINTELRFPILTELQIGFLGSFPPVDAVAFFDGGMAWDRTVCTSFDYTRSDRCAEGQREGVRTRWVRKQGEDPFIVREPLFSYGLGMRINIFYTVLRLDYAWALNRLRGDGMFSLSFGPSF